MMKRKSALATAILLGVSANSLADEFDGAVSYLSYSDFGGVGLLQTPTARMANEGMFSINIRANEDYNYYSVSTQIFPWLEAGIRYAIVKDVLYSPYPGFSGDTEYADKGIDVKLTLLEEAEYLPELAVGLRDLGGTGLFGGEYLVANKRYHDFDVSVGVGFGYLGQGANLAGDNSSDIDCGRDGSSGKGGNVDFQRWFTGCVGVFGGVSYQTPYQPLSLKLEYDANDFSNDRPVKAGKEMPYESPWNFGAVYAYDDWGQITLSYQRGAVFSVGFSLLADLGSNNRRWNDSAKPQLDTSAQATEDWHALARELQSSAGYVVNSISQQGDTLAISGIQKKYRDSYQANERAFILMANAQPSAQQYKIIYQSYGVDVLDTTVLREDLTAYANAEAPELNYESLELRSSPVAPQREQIRYELDEGWTYSFEPTLEQSFGGPEGFYFFNLGLSGGASYWLTDNLRFAASAYLNIYDNYDRFNFTIPSDGTDLPRVRTLIRQYLENNTLALSTMKLEWFERFGDDHFVAAHAGYLERMYGGGVLEYLYRPVDSRWSIGFDAAYVVQRDPFTSVGFYSERYQTEEGKTYEVLTGDFTGHVNLHYRVPDDWLKGINTSFSVGKYLAGDVGVTAAFNKTFDSGVVIGAFATKTNLSAEEYGEGSFTKGFYISMPFDLFNTRHTNSRANIGWLPLTRDGGQKLNFGPSLYGISGVRSPVRWRAAQ